MKKLLSLIIMFAFMSLVMSCGGGEEKAEKPGEQATEKAEVTGELGGYQSMEVTNGGTIKGTVTFAGAIPPRQKVQITKDVQVCGNVPHYKEDLVVTGNRRIANVVVRITNVNKGKSIDALGAEFVLDQDGCTFKPHVVLVPAGAELSILNSDGILHNVHTFSEKNTPINVAQPKFKKKITQTFNEPEYIRVACDVHNWMGGYIVVVDHPYYAITDENGHFELTDVPAGTYILEYWQETLGTRTAEVTVTEGGTVEANIEFAAGTASASL